ncbi:MAG: hypothetical protein H7Z13_09170 [Ferruginibacter sp.]|nr:hypothetical protein [Ferruginibacter sp.]
MKGLLHFILSHSIFIAFCTAALSLQTLQLLSLTVNNYLLAFIFFAAVSGYNAYWMISRFTFNPPPSFLYFLQKNRRSFIVVLLAVTGMFFCISNLRLVWYNIIIAIVLLGLYAIPVMPFKQLHFTRRAGFVKTILLAFTWAIVTTLIPLQVSILEMEHAALLIFINRFLFMLMLCVIFDKRDVQVDKIRGLQSLATIVKPRVLNYLMGFIFIGYALVSYSMKWYELTMAQVAALIVTGLITITVYAASFKKRGYLFYYFLVDGLMFLSALLTGLAGVVR